MFELYYLVHRENRETPRYLSLECEHNKKLNANTLLPELVSESCSGSIRWGRSFHLTGQWVSVDAHP